MKKLRKKINFEENVIEAYCMCGCSCRPYESQVDERHDYRMYLASNPPEYNK